MKIRFILIGATISLILGIAIMMLSFDTIPYEPPDDLPGGITPIVPEVGKTSTPSGPYMIFVGIMIFVGAGIYLSVNFLKRKIKR